MSHFTTLVIGDNPEELLAPFDENLKVEPYRSYEDEEKPQDRWDWDTLTEAGAIAEGADWPTYIEAARRHWDEENRKDAERRGYAYDPDVSEHLHYDAESDRVYHMSTYNPKSKWDWYSLGGRWTGYFPLRSTAGGKVGRQAFMAPAAKAGWVDQARKGDIDFALLKGHAEAEAISNHTKVRAVLADIGTPHRWEYVREQMFPNDIDGARRFYHDQPGVKALHKADIYADDPTDHFCLDADDPQAAFVAREVQRAGIPFAILSAGGWAEEGRMGWWAVVTNERDDWHETARQIIDAAPDTSLFSLYDLHI